jgi:hypothetical protein
MIPTLPVPHDHLASEHTRSRRSVRLLPTVQIVDNSHVILLVSSGEANSRRRLISRAAHNVNLCALLYLKSVESIHRNAIIAQRTM